MLAVVFPGQGSQVSGMGRGVAAAYPAAAEVFAQADQILALPLTRLCFEGPDAELKPTEIAQPALLTAGYATFQAVRDQLGQPVCYAGHSLGEYTALVAAGSLSFLEALTLVRKRGELMRDAAAKVPGAMAAVLSLDDEVVERLCAEATGIVVPANLNSPGQVVVSGESEAITALLDAVKAAGGKARALPVSGAFHSPLMQEAQDAMRVQLGRVSFHDATVPVVQNVVAQPVTGAEQLKEHLAAQITGRVRWTESVREMAAAGVTQIVELGPGKVLTGLVKRIAPDIACYNVDSAEAAAGLADWLEAQHG